MAPKGFGDLFKKKAKKAKVVNPNAGFDESPKKAEDEDEMVRIQTLRRERMKMRW